MLFVASSAFHLSIPLTWRNPQPPPPPPLPPSCWINDTHKHRKLPTPGHHRNVTDAWPPPPVALAAPHDQSNIDWFINNLTCQSFHLQTGAGPNEVINRQRQGQFRSLLRIIWQCLDMIRKSMSEQSIPANSAACRAGHRRDGIGLSTSTNRIRVNPQPGKVEIKLGKENEDMAWV